jgi:two-component system, LuxR family, sensor kinase FixL
MAIVHAAAALRAVLIGMTLKPSGGREGRAAAASRGNHHGASTMTNDAAFHDTLERLPLAMLIVDTRGRIAFANARAQTLFGYARHEMVGAAAETILPGLRAHDSTATLFACRKDRSQFLADINLSALEMPGTLAVVIDRTEHDEVRRNRQELAHLTRVSMLGELAASLAHELNQPLTAILSNAQAAQRFIDADPIDLDEVREILRDLVSDTNRASDILRRIRTLVRKGELELAPCSVASVIGDVALLVHSDAIARGIRVTLDIDPHLPLVRGDKIQLQQVVLNLLLNAFDATDDSDGERHVAVSAAREGEDIVRVSVRDDGRGLPAAMMHQLFKPFCTSKRDGLGLGLSISRSIVEMHGGRIWAQNNATRGATLFFTLLTDESHDSARIHRR